MDLKKSIIELLDDEVNESLKLNEIPIGAVIFKTDDQSIVSSGHNTRQSDCNLLGHAEINAIVLAEKVLNDWRLDGYSMVVSLSPCKMCSSIIEESRLDNIYYILNSNYINAGNGNFIKLNNLEIYEKKYNDLLKFFFHNKR